MENQALNPVRGQFRIKISGIDLKFREIEINDPVPTGRQIIEAAGGNPPDDYVLLQWAGVGDLRVINLDETVDLRAHGEERFTYARSDRLFEFEIDSHKTQWPEQFISRDVLLAVAGQDRAKFSVWQEFKHEPDKEILAGHPADLGPKGTERFYTVHTHTTEGSP